MGGVYNLSRTQLKSKCDDPRQSMISRCFEMLKAPATRTQHPPKPIASTTGKCPQQWIVKSRTPISNNQAAASAVAAAFDSASHRAKIAADAAALEISILRSMLKEAQGMRSKGQPCTSSTAQKPAAAECDPSDSNPGLDSGWRSNVGGMCGGHGSCKLTQSAVAAARVHFSSCGDSGVCAGEAMSRDRLQPSFADGSPRIGGKYWRKLSVAVAPKLNGTSCASPSPSMANPASLLSPTSFRGSSPGFSPGLKGRLASLGGKREPSGCNPWERGGGAPARMLAPPDGPERRERAQAGWGK